MSFNFDEFLQKGKGAAENVLQNRKEIKEVLTDLQTSLAQFLELEIEFEERTEFESDDSDPFSRIAGAFKPRKSTGYNVVYIKSAVVDVDRAIFKLKRSDDIYPITIAKDKNHFVSDDQGEFASAVGQVVSNSVFHLQLNAFKRQIEEKLKGQLLPVPKSK